MEPDAPFDAPSWGAFAAGWEIFRDPLLCGVAAGAVLGFLGVFIVLRRMVFVSAGVTQSAGLGVALALYADIHFGFHVDPLYGAAALALLATLAVSLDTRPLRVPREAVLGLAFALGGGGAVLIGDRLSHEAHEIESILFGSAVLVRPFDLQMVLVSAVLVLVVHGWCLRGLLFASFDPDAARVQGLPVRVLDGVLFLSVGLTVGVSARALGALPVFAFSVLPATTALVLGVRLPWAFAVAALLGALSGAAGYIVAFFYRFPVGASQTVVAAAFMAAALLVVVLRRRAVRLLRPAAPVQTDPHP